MTRHEMPRRTGSGTPRVIMPYVGGMPAYPRKCEEVAAEDHKGFRFVRDSSTPTRWEATALDCDFGKSTQL